MKVKFTSPWFSPTSVDRPNKLQSISGKFYRRGVHDVPDSLIDLLPRSAEILNGPVREEKAPVNTLRDFDHVRAEGEALTEAAEKADRNLDNMAKARKAKAEKDAAKRAARQAEVYG